MSTFPTPAESLRILLLGAGGREHALAHRLALSPRVEGIWVAPGNGGTAEAHAHKVHNLTLPWGSNFQDLVAWAQENKIDMVVPGPEQPLVDGVEAVFRKGESPLSDVSSFSRPLIQG